MNEVVKVIRAKFQEATRQEELEKDPLEKLYLKGKKVAVLELMIRLGISLE